MTTTVNEPAARQTAAATLPRLLPAAPEDLRAHLARYGPTPYRGQAGLLIGDLEASGLTGRGGAAFPVHRKLAIVAQARGGPFGQGPQDLRSGSVVRIQVSLGSAGRLGG